MILPVLVVFEVDSPGYDYIPIAKPCAVNASDPFACRREDHIDAALIQPPLIPPQLYASGQCT